MGPFIRGSVHVHSMDAALPFVELVDRHRQRGYAFLCITDHPDEVGEAGFVEREALCTRLTDPGFVCLYGIEGATASGPHLMGVGVRSFIPLYALEFGAAVEAVRSAGGVAVLAHPSVADLRQVSGDGCLPDAVEVWNGLRAGWAPDPRLIAELSRLGAGWAGLPLLGGPDAHRPGHLFKIDILLEAGRLDRRVILDALRAGRLWLRRGRVEIAGRWPARSPVHEGLFHFSRGVLLTLRHAKRWLRGDTPPLVPQRLISALERIT